MNHLKSKVTTLHIYAKHFHCYLLGTYYGNGPNYPDDGGATLNESAFLPSGDLYSIAIAYFDSAIVYADEHQENIHSLLGRQYLYEGNYSAAAQHASLGLQQSDESLMHFREEDPWPLVLVRSRK